MTAEDRERIKALLHGGVQEVRTVLRALALRHLDCSLFHETRLYMRARHQLADMLLEAERFDEAIGHFEAMLELNPNNNQGIREVLLATYLTVSNLAGARRVLTVYADDCGAVFAWARVLERLLSLQFPEAEAALAEARRGNRFVELYLTGARKLTRTMPAMYSLGSMKEAQLCLKNVERRMDRASAGNFVAGDATD